MRHDLCKDLGSLVVETPSFSATCATSSLSTAFFICWALTGLFSPVDTQDFVSSRALRLEPRQDLLQAPIRQQACDHRKQCRERAAAAAASQTVENPAKPAASLVAA